MLRRVAATAKHLITVLAIPASLASMVALAIQIMPDDPDEELSYIAPVRSREVFNAGETQKLQLYCEQNGELHRIHNSVDATDVEITNTGERALWYKSQGKVQNVLSPVYVQLEPAVQVLAAWVIWPDEPPCPDRAEFRVVPDNGWDSGRVFCEWRCLDPGQRVQVHILHVKPSEPLDVLVNGELKESPNPTRALPQRVRTPEEERRRRVWVLVVFGVFVAAAIVWRVVRIRRSQRQDRTTLLELPAEAAPGTWQRPWWQYWARFMWLDVLLIVALVLVLLILHM